MKNNFYTYIYIHPRTKLPFYVGKGNGSRSHYHLNHAIRHPNPTKNQHLYNKIRKILREKLFPTIIVSDNCSEQEAFDMERELIKFYGRLDHKTGTLINRTDGGEGVSNPTRDKSSWKKNGRNMQGENNPRYGITQGNEQKQKFKTTIERRKKEGVFVSKLKNRIVAEETKQKQSLDRKNRPQIKGEKLDALLLKYKEIIELYNTHPILKLKYSYISKNGKVFSYENAFSSEYAETFNLTPQGLSKIITGGTKSMQTLINNSDYEILSKTGFQNFDGIVKSQKNTIKISFQDGSNLICTENHRVFSNGMWIEASKLKLHQKIEDKEILYISAHQKIDVYDPINVSNGNSYTANGIESHNCQFLGSSKTLINGDTMGRLTPTPFVYSKDSLDVLEIAKENHTYVLVADTSKGVGGDNSAFTVIDITELPYTIVAKYKNNNISPLLYPSVIHAAATIYNNAYTLIEINSSEQVAEILHTDLEYENILYVSRGKHGQIVSAGFGGANPNLGVNTDKKVKRIGCNNLKTLIEENKLIVTDSDIISEISTFVEHRGSYAADDGYKDDLIMTLVLFAWLTTQDYFKDLTNVNLRTLIYQARMQEIENSVLPIGFVNTGKEDEDEEKIVMGNDVWVMAKPENEF